MPVSYYRAVAVWDDGKAETTHRSEGKAMEFFRKTYDPDGVYADNTDHAFIENARTEGLYLSITRHSL